LAEARPVVDQRQAWRAAPDEDDGCPLILVVGDRDDPVREQRTGRIELPAVQDAAAVLVPEDRGLKIDRGLRADLGEGVAEAVAVERRLEIEPLLRLRAGETDGLDHVPVILRDLAEAGVRR